VTTALPSLTLDDVSVDHVRPNRANPRRIGEDELESLTRSLRKFGFVQPVLALSEVSDGRHPIGQDRAPGSRPGPWKRNEPDFLRGVPLTSGHRGRPRAASSLRPRLGLQGCSFVRDDLGSRIAERSLSRLRLASKARGVLIPVPLAHPAEAVLLARLGREVLDRRVVGLDPEPGRADALSKVCHVGRPFAGGRWSGGRTFIHHSDRVSMQVRGSW
jgi:hypothetical protein